MQQHEQYSDPRERDDAPVTAAKDIHPDGALLAESVTINRPAEELYEFWRNPANLVDIMENVVRIEPIGPDRSLWTVAAPGGNEVSWESVITKEVPGREIYWQSAEGADIRNSGRIQFEEAGQRGTIVRAVIAYDPPGRQNRPVPSQVVPARAAHPDPPRPPSLQAVDGSGRDSHRRAHPTPA